MAYRHGVYVREQPTSMVAPVTGTAGLQVVIGTAPVHLLKKPESAVNKPILVGSFKEAVESVGYSDDFAKYTICEAVSASFRVCNVAPLVLINVLDPRKHSVDMPETNFAVNKGVALIDEQGILLDELTVKNGEAVLTQEDYAASFNDDGTVSLVMITGGKGDGAVSLTVGGKKLDPSKVTTADIVGGVDTATGKETGMEVIRQVFPKLGMTPGILIAPRYSADAVVSAALQAKTHDINGCFGVSCIVDVDSSSTGAKKYTDVKEKKESQGLTDSNAYAVWPYGKVGEVIYSGSALAAAATAYNDAINDDTPNASPSNKSVPISGLCLEDGTEVVLDQEQANTINSFGVATFLNMNGFRLWGNNTVAYPGNTDPKDRWFCCRRFMTWRANSFILTYFQRVDSPMNRRLIEAIVDSENVLGNGFVARGVCARYEIEFLEEDNPTAEMLDGKVVFHQYMTPFPPAEDIENRTEFDINALKAALG